MGTMRVTNGFHTTARSSPEDDAEPFPVVWMDRSKQPGKGNTKGGHTQDSHRLLQEHKLWCRASLSI